jgi:hypothetical protein
MDYTTSKQVAYSHVYCSMQDSSSEPKLCVPKEVPYVKLREMYFSRFQITLLAPST